MIKVVAKHFVKEEKVNEFIENAKKLVKVTNEEAGCMKYELCVDVKNPKILTILEEWVDKAALDKHMATEHFLAIVPMLEGFIEKQTEVNLYNKIL
jgi:quinol monooxygenase YgiN